MQNLPITQVIPQIKEQLSKNPNVVLQAPPGAGKTTALPLALLNETWLQNRQIIMLDPTTPLPSKKELPFLVHRKLLHILKHEEGNILVFLAGVREIKKVEQLLRSTLSNKTYISTLYQRSPRQSNQSPTQRETQNRSCHQHRPNFFDH